MTVAGTAHTVTAGQGRMVDLGVARMRVGAGERRRHQWRSLHARRVRR